MRIDEQAQQCVAFLSVEGDATAEGKSFRVVGTTFFIGEDLGNDRWIQYAVTARHVIDGSRSHGPLRIRCVSRDRAKRKIFELPQERWWAHPSTDIALTPISIPLEDYDLRFLPTTLFSDDAWMREWDIGVGDHLAVPGLLTNYVGKERDEPGVRFGRVTLIPDHPLCIDPQGGLPGFETDSILAEFAAWPGQSGSPAFIYFSVDRDLFAGNKINWKIPSTRLLGLVHGHYVVRQPLRQKGDEFPDAHVPLNSGIAILIPATKIVEILESDDANDHRERCRNILREDGLLD